MNGFPTLVAVLSTALTGQHVAGSMTRAATMADSVSIRLARELGAFLRDRVAGDQFSGVVVVARDGTPIFSRAYGYADKRVHRPNTIDTRFNLGSANKIFTAVAIAQLVEKERLALDSPFVRYLPDYPNRAIASRVTIRQLLSHTSGMGSYFTRAFMENHDKIKTVSDLLRFFVNDSLQFAPGSRFGYSNAGFVVLGLVIERVSGERFDDYVRRYILAPAGMTRTGFDAVPSLRGDYAIGYTIPPGPDGKPGPGPRMDNSALIEVRGSPAGGAYSTAHDLIAFSRALWSGKLVRRSLVDEFTHGQVKMGPMMYALGFGEATQSGGRIVGHNGGAPGVNAEFDMYPAAGYDVVVLSNYDPPSATAVITKAREILVGSAEATAQTMPNLSEYIGQYGERSITMNAGRLYLQRVGGPVHTLRSLGNDLFASEQMPDAQMRFVRDDQHRIVAISVRLPDGTWESSPRSRP
jgi:D-alanyl-D-alanine carboxypeptidase